LEKVNCVVPQFVVHRHVARAFGLALPNRAVLRVKRRRRAAPGPALPAPGSALGGPPGAPAPSHCRATSIRQLNLQVGAPPVSSASIVRIVATASRAALRAVACDRLRRPWTPQPLTWVWRLRGRRRGQVAADGEIDAQLSQPPQLLRGLRSRECVSIGKVDLKAIAVTDSDGLSGCVRKADIGQLELDPN
jgi:hypothetical protein